MALKQLNLRFITVSIAAATLFGCEAFKPMAPSGGAIPARAAPTAVIDPNSGVTETKNAFNTHCQSCHGVVATFSSALRLRYPDRDVEKTITLIKGALTTVPAMTSLSAIITEPEVREVAELLTTAKPTPIVDDLNPLTATELLSQKCASCHLSQANLSELLVQRWGYLTQSQIRTKLDTAIRSAIDMATFTVLSSERRDEVAAALVTAQPTNQVPEVPKTGGELFGIHCLSCHAMADKTSATSATISAAISTIPDMSGLSGLTSAKIDLIAAYLLSNKPADPPPPLTATEIMITQCVGCHVSTNQLSQTLVFRWGYLTNTGIRAKIDAAITAQPQMQTFSTLTVAIRDELAAMLYVAAPPSPGPSTAPVELTGQQLFSAFCSACHTRAAKSTASISSINNAIAQIPSMSSLSNLTALKISRIQEYLAGGIPTLDLNPILIVGNRHYLEDRLTAAFAPALAANANFLKSFNLTIKNNLTDRMDAFGGSCLRNDDKGCSNYDNLEAQLGTNTLANPLRRGSLTATCDGLITYYGVVSNLMAADGITTVNSTSASQAFKRFYPLLVPSTAVINSMVNLGASMSAGAQTNVAIWTVIYRELCVNLLMEPL